jgi:hypothetical protein
MGPYQVVRLRDSPGRLPRLASRHAFRHVCAGIARVRGGAGTLGGARQAKDSRRVQLEAVDTGTDTPRRGLQHMAVSAE